MPTCGRAGTWVVIVGLAALAGCGSALDCAQVNETRYRGRPPARLFAYDTSCRADCYSSPVDATCARSCAPVAVEEPLGLLRGDRWLRLIDGQSLGKDPAPPHQPLALVFSFGFVDEAGGVAPADWTFLTAGQRSYLSDQTDGSARFLMTVSVHGLLAPSAEPSGGIGLTEAIGEAIDVTPGRLDIERADEERLRGEFFLAFETPTRQPQSQVQGCFDLFVGPAVVDWEGGMERALGL